jgi:hypothetical protein
MRHPLQIQLQDFAAAAPPPIGAMSIVGQLEAARALIESRFSDAGEKLAFSG